MADPITFRPTGEDLENLAVLTADGSTPTSAIRLALRLASREKRHADLRADAKRLMSNPEYLDEVSAIRAEMDDIRAW